MQFHSKYHCWLLEIKETRGTRYHMYEPRFSTKFQVFTIKENSGNNKTRTPKPQKMENVTALRYL